MSAIANFLARRCWYWMLYFMRRPWMKRLQHRWLREVPGDRHLQFPNSFKNQNRFARRWGLPLLQLSFNLFLASVFVTFAYFTAVTMYENGLFNPPPKAVASSDAFH
jgi:predicted MFS family arabinose efflux permease